MSQGLRTWTVAALFAAFGGCVDADPKAPSGLAEGLDGPPGPQLALSQCQAWYATGMFPTAIVPAARPEGWAGRGPVAGVTINALDCGRIAVGPFERGPVTLLWDSHDNAEPPEACAARQGVLRLSTVLNALWVSDAEVADHLASSYGMPVRVGLFTKSTEPLPGAAVHEWTWGEPGAEPSRLRILEDPDQGSADGRHHRLFWAAGDGVGWLDLDTDGNGPGFEAPAEGTMRSPMLLAGMPGGAVALSGKWFSSTDSTGTFQLFDDLACGQPKG